MNILFRADSSSMIGTGHIMRDLVLAEEFKDSQITFATQQLAGNINYKIEEKGFDIVILNSNAIEELMSLVKNLRIDMVVIDHYDIEYEFEKKLKETYPKLKIFVMDDTYEKHYCDLLLNHNVYGDDVLYKHLVPSFCQIKCGENYTLLRDEFKVEKQRGRQNKNDKDNLNVFIAMGGADHSNINIKILEVLSGFQNIHSHVVTTSANKHLQDLQEYVNAVKDVTLYVNTNVIAKLMNEADFAIITPSVTINEIMYLDVPFIAIKTADNQKYMYDYLVKKDLYILENFDRDLLTQYVKSLISKYNQI